MKRNRISAVSIFKNPGLLLIKVLRIKVLIISSLILPGLVFAGGGVETHSGRSVFDSLGNEVVLEGTPERIAVVGKATLITADALYLFPEVRGRVIGLGKTDQGLGDFYPLLDPSLDEKKRVDHEVGPEQIAALNPDLVIVKDYLYEKLGKPVARLGIPTAGLALESPEQYIRDIEIIGKLLDNEERAREVIAFYEAGIAAVEQGVGSIPAGERPEVLMLYYSDRGGEIAFNIPPASWIQTAQVEKAGGNAVWKEVHQGGGWKTVNFEQIASWNPDYIVITSYNSEPEQFLPAILADSRWQELKAAKRERIVAVPSDFHSWAQPDTRWILGMKWLAGLLHPDRFEDMEMKEEVMQFYTRLYDVKESLVREIILPRLEGEIAD